ncbi:PH domain-containing protein [Tepidibacter formicigenes]|jgi:predicted RNA-binding protein with PIN domain|uniref:Short C-terminal domain-containing protein n=1 Tax=Tepidibacter formicigenes DSM 15518 TaxID=1123349 RepID=A0A1M6UGN3_9FIRM|nr:PH domain-containing protein [Tepidibacter formicigenes]SHK68392.1 Short C-terminal domain-containing protein [Tepidibacter formicigenes DSM 15518]
MPTLEEIKNQLQMLDTSSKLLGKKEIKELPKILWEDEKIEKLVQGMYNNNIGILVATNKRLIFVDKSFFGLKVEDFPYDKISSIQYETSIMQGSITIFASGNKAEIKHIMKDQVRNFAEYVRARITKTNKSTNENQSNVNTNNQNNIDIYDEIISRLEKLGKLKEQGILTEEEFLEQKNNILALSK